jgi:hypothetical protein
LFKKCKYKQLTLTLDVRWRAYASAGRFWCVATLWGGCKCPSETVACQKGGDVLELQYLSNVEKEGYNMGIVYNSYLFPWDSITMELGK